MLIHGCDTANGGNTFIDTGAVATWPPESVTFAVKLNVPALVSLPVNVPPALSASPGGTLPFATDQVYGAVPPVAWKLTAR